MAEELKAEQAVLDFEAVADMIIVIAVDGREIELPRRDLVVVPGPRARGRYLRPESALEPPPVCMAPPPAHRPPYRTGRR